MVNSIAFFVGGGQSTSEGANGRRKSQVDEGMIIPLNHNKGAIWSHPHILQGGPPLVINGVTRTCNLLMKLMF